ncbi:MFS general substrate transporter [Polychaeton citri CBS 116435]|uniref:MFS general substrate transporter n=1 Tax=Polychaeton citri CBS 116435 TaxID=1314669 RepID=A0A9P4QCG7_9PEZI|nr:MFS general substrate transporter [Polychaeton citri CBS 116435]
MRLRSLNELEGSESTVQLHSDANDSKIILHPKPSPNDPNDPLRWPLWKKHVLFASVCAFTFLTNFGLGGMGPSFYTISIQFHKSESQTQGLLLWPILTLGLGNFFWVPLCTYFGKRPMFIISCFILWVCFLWGALSPTFDSLLASSIVAALAGASTETLTAGVVNDIYFLHERANKMSFYTIAISSGNTIGPLICGFIVDSLSWRWMKWIAFILTLVNWLVILAFCPETRYDRSADNALSSGSSTPQETITEAKTADTAAKDIDPTQFDTVERKSWVQGLKLWSGVPRDTNLLLMYIRPLPTIAYPAVIFSFLGYAVSLAWVSAINLLNPFVLQAPPYSWSASVNGLINIPGFIGNLLGAFGGGWLVDRYSDWRSKKNGGVFRPEARLHLLVFPAVIVPAGCLAFGYGVARQLHWTAMFFGYGMVAFGLTFVPTATMTYVSDCYLPVNADALLMVNAIKNIIGFGVAYGLTPWANQAGFINSFGTQAGIYVAIMALAIPLALFGERIRHSTARWKIIL